MNQYFYIDVEGKQKGTFSPEGLQNEPIRKDTLVWTQGMEQWTRADEIPELQFLFAAQAVSPEVSQSPIEPSAAYAPSPSAPPMPKTWMVESILATILPFLLCSCIFSLLGIVGIVNASKVESLYRSGAYNEAQEASRQAKLWTKVAMWIGIGWVILFILLIVGFFMFFGSLDSINQMLSA